MSGPVLVINPNSNTAVTAGLDAALAAFRFADSPAIECVTLADGPYGIESQADSDRVVPPLLDLVARRPDAGAIVIACYSDPGLDACRAATAVPVFGMQESGVLTAMARADLFGVVAIGPASILRHRKYMRRMGVLERLAGERPLGLSVADTAGDEATFARLHEVGAALRDDGAGAILLGCAGLSWLRGQLARSLGVPVIDPTQAAVAMALSVLCVESD